MNLNIWTAKIYVAFNFFFFIHVHKQYVDKSIATCKIKCIYNQPKPYIFLKLL